MRSNKKNGEMRGRWEKKGERECRKWAKRNEASWRRSGSVCELK